jgi:hypothetical protein
MVAKPKLESSPEQDPEFVATLKRMLETPPKPHKDEPKKRPSQPKLRSPKRAS